MDRRDEVVSPARYGGALSAVRIDYAGAWKQHRTDAVFEVGNGTLTSDGNAASREEMYDVAIELSYARRVRRTFVGAVLRGRADAVSHYYGNPTLSDDFGVAALTLSPVIDCEPWGAGALRNVRVRASAPIVTLLARPYSRLNITGGRPPWRIAYPWEVPSVAVHLSHVTNTARRLALRTAYSLEMQAVREAYGLAAVENRVSIGAVLRFGRAP